MDMMGRDNHEAGFHYAPNPNRIKYVATIAVPAIGSRTVGKPTTATAATFARQFTRHHTIGGLCSYQQRHLSG